MLSKRTEVFDPDKNFWEVYPELKVHPAFSKLYREDKNKKKSDSSNVMWALHLTHHPKSIMYYDPNKLEAVKSMLPQDWSWSSKPELLLLEAYKGFMLSEAQRALTDWDDMIKKRSTYLKTQDYNLENGKDLDALHKNTYAIYKDYQKICEELKIEEESGNETLSLSESGEI